MRHDVATHFATLRKNVPPRHAAARLRAGFTLVELMVVIGILLLIAAMTLSVVNLSITGDRTRGAARQIQSYLEGARGRAIYGGNATTQGGTYQCGVRFIRDSNNPNLVASMQYVEVDPERGALAAGVFGIQYDANNLAKRLVGTVGSPNEQLNTHWLTSYQQGLIFNNQVILMDNRRYQIDTSELQAGNEVLLLQTPYVGTSMFTAPGDVNGFAVPKMRQPPYKLLLAPQPMANQEPRSLGNGVVLDLNLSKGLAAFGSTLQIDLMFSPRGTVVGPLAGTGIVEFVVSDREDSLKGVPLPNSANPNPTPKRDRLIVSLTPQTGKTAVHPVYTDPTGATYDPYRYAETGEVAKQ